MHVGTAEKASKTECMYYPPHRRDAIDSKDKEPVQADDKGGFVTFTERFKYLGSSVDESLSDDAEVSKRIKAASGAFGAMRKQVFESKHISRQTKKVVYVTLIINILLYGSECWCLTETLLHQLRSFHHHCIRVMCGVTRWHVWRHHIRNAELRKRLRLETLDFYVELRQLRWAGHVARMGYERISRRFLTSWVFNPRPHGRPQFTYGHSLNKTLKRAELPTDFKKWSQLAQNREAWRERIYGRAEYPSLAPNHSPDQN